MRFITLRRDYQRVYRDNDLRVLKGNLFIFLIREDDLEDSLAIGIVVSRKVGKAVIRNKIKRRVKAFLRESEPVNLTGKDIVIISKPEAGYSNWKEIKKDLVELFIQIQ
jgi:ribonuclease P protein component